MKRNTPKFVRVETQFTPQELNKVIVTPVTHTKKIFWGLWSRSETELYMFLPGGVYQMDTSGKLEEMENDREKAN